VPTLAIVAKDSKALTPARSTLANLLSQAERLQLEAQPLRERLPLHVRRGLGHSWLGAHDFRRGIAVSSRFDRRRADRAWRTRSCG
jgi:hypothetical protein